MTKVETIAKQLKVADFDIVSIVEPEDGMDGEIVISNLVYVQVGRGYIIVNKWVDNGETIRHWPTRKSADQVVADLRDAMVA